MSIIDRRGGESAQRDLDWPSGDMVELSLLLPDWQAAELEAAAHGQGLTTGQMMRHILQDFFKVAHVRTTERYARF
jgi:hypothetical protein